MPKNQLKSELIEVLKLFKEVYADFNIADFWYRLSLPDFKNEEKYGDIKDKQMWEESAEVAEQALKEFGVKYEKGEGEATFYGPKIDVQTKKCFRQRRHHRHRSSGLLFRQKI